MPSGKQCHSESLSVNECSLMGLPRVACTTRHVSVNHTLLSDRCLAHTHECERQHRLQWGWFNIDSHRLYRTDSHFGLLLRFFSSTGADFLTTPGRMSNLPLLHRSIICSMRSLLTSTHLLWTHAHIHIHTHFSQLKRPAMVTRIHCVLDAGQHYCAAVPTRLLN